MREERDLVSEKGEEGIRKGKTEESKMRFGMRETGTEKKTSSTSLCNLSLFQFSNKRDCAYICENCSETLRRQTRRKRFYRF